MPYSESLAQRVRSVVARRPGLAEKRMFGGVGFLLHGNMCVALWQDSLVVRVGPRQYADALARPYVKEFDITGRAMTGWVVVSPDGVDADRELRAWVERGVQFAASLPAKQEPKAKSKKKPSSARQPRVRKHP